MLAVMRASRCLPMTRPSWPRAAPSAAPSRRTFWGTAVTSRPSKICSATGTWLPHDLHPRSRPLPRRVSEPHEALASRWMVSSWHALRLASPRQTSRLEQAAAWPLSAGLPYPAGVRLGFDPITPADRACGCACPSAARIGWTALTAVAEERQIRPMQSWRSEKLT